MNIYEYKTKRVVKLRFKILALALFLLMLLLFLKPALILLAEFLDMPRSTVFCDVIIIEGGPAFSEYSVMQALEAYKSGQAQKIILVLHSFDSDPTIFGVKNYRFFIETAFDSLGIPANDYRLLLLDIVDPYTYNSALALADTLHGVQSILLLNDNFHMRRSFLTFKKIFDEKNISVYPYTYNIYLNSTNWWTSANGWRRVVTEYLKLIFYRIKGYI